MLVRSESVAVDASLVATEACPTSGIRTPNSAGTTARGGESSSRKRKRGQSDANNAPEALLPEDITVKVWHRINPGLFSYAYIVDRHTHH